MMVRAAPDIDPEVAEIIAVISLMRAGGRVCICCRQVFLSAGADNRVCPTCTATSDDGEWIDVA